MTPTTASHLNPDNESLPNPAPVKPRPLRSLTASASRITSQKIKRAGHSSASKGASATSWQDDAWEMFDLVGEEHFLATTLAQRVGQANLYIGRVPEDDDNGEPEPVEPGSDADVLELFADTQAQRAQILTRAGVNLFVAGDGYIVGVPHSVFDDEMPARPISAGIDPFRPIADGPDMAELDMADLEWRFLSTDEVKFQSEGTVTVTWDGYDGDRLTEVDPDRDLFIIRVWRPHPRKASHADSPTRASLPVLRELVGLTMHVSAQVDSRLAGAGVFAIAQSVIDAQVQSDDPDEEGDPSDFINDVVDHFITPVADRSNASALVPFLMGVPNDGTDRPVSDYFHYQSFSSPLDGEARELRDEAIRRLALGQDTPPELLLGVGSMNHWGAWLVREDVITTHVEPPLALICDALTTQFLWPLLEAQGMGRDEAKQYVVWYSVEHLISRPNRFAEADALNQRNVISDEAMREVAGFPETAAPPQVEEQNDPAVTLALELVGGAPSLVQNPGLPTLVDQIRAVLMGTPAPEPVQEIPAPEEPAEPLPEESEDETPSEGEIPATSDDEAPAIAASGSPGLDSEREARIRQFAEAFRSAANPRRSRYPSVEPESETETEEEPTHG